ncbi:Mpp10 protein-domain-containing protein [Xylogone sp. PMI_703]|nr:Mpp10 protein-domain-containing protein [Xylogone sp. PMI_703]
MPTMATAGSTTSSMTSTSHTLTAFPPNSTSSSFPVQSPMNSSPMADLLAALTPANRHVFIQPPKALVNSSLEFAKTTLDSFAAQLGEEQAARQKEERKKRKRGDRSAAEGEILKIRKIHTEGFEVDQVWEQTRRVIDALRVDAERALGELSDVDEDEDAGEDVSEDGGARLREFDEDGFEVGSDDDEEMLDGVEDDFEEEDEDEEGLGEEDDEGEDDAELDGEDVEDQDDYGEEEDGDDFTPADTFVEDPNGLNDGFFSIDDFNKQTEFLERQDAAGDPYTGEASDEEDIDWDVDPLAMADSRASSKRKSEDIGLGEEEDGTDDEDEDEGGPTFGDMDLNAPEGESGDEEDGEEGSDLEGDQGGVLANTNDITYKDFFEPPPRKISKKELEKRFAARQDRAQKPDQGRDEKSEIERAMADVKRDLFDDESDIEDSEDALSDVDPADPKSRKSAHERRQAKLSQEIRRLEALSVAKREWTLSGEAKAADRPVNSLLEEDLDFERTGKPVPVITAEVSESIEDLIKRRILAQQFDEVIRRRPDASDLPSSTRRGLFELDDTKPQQSLAEIYEEEHIKNTNPDTYVSKSDEKLRKEEKEIEQLWKEVSAKLDALSSWHYKPKPPAPNLTVVADVATVSMEDAQPTTASGMTGLESMLAPQEIYKAGQEKAAIEKGEVVPKSGAPVARQEMTREEKLRRRRREKERIKKQGGLDAKKRPLSKKAQEKKDTIGELKKGGVRVIGRKGEIRDIDGNKVQASGASSGAGGFKL